MKTKYRHLKPKIEAIIEKKPWYGYPRIKRALYEKYGEVVNHKLLLKLLRIWGLSMKRKVKRKKKSWIQKVIAFLGIRANLLFGASVNRVFQVIVSDITEIKYANGKKKAYLASHLDYYGKMILGWSLSTSPDTDLVLGSFKKSKTRVKRLLGVGRLTGIIFHQDQGSVYTSTDYTTAVLGEDAFLSFCRKGEAGDNAVKEAFFSRLKEERRDEFAETKDFWELEKLLEKLVDYYNYERYHTSVGNKRPWVFTRKCLKRLASGG